MEPLMEGEDLHPWSDAWQFGSMYHSSEVTAFDELSDSPEHNASISM
jgi:hypothetical protein